MMCYEATRHAVSLRNFIRDLGVVNSIESPIVTPQNPGVRCVSNSALGLSYGHGILTIYEN